MSVLELDARLPKGHHSDDVAALLNSEVILIGRVAKIEKIGPENIVRDGSTINAEQFRATVSDMAALKGDASGNQIVIRQIYVRLPDGLIGVNDPPSSPPKEGLSYLLFLSHLGQDYAPSPPGKFAFRVSKCPAELQGKRQPIEGSLRLIVRDHVQDANEGIAFLWINFLSAMYDEKKDRQLFIELTADKRLAIRGFALATLLKYGDYSKLTEAIDYVLNIGKSGGDSECRSAGWAICNQLERIEKRPIPAELRPLLKTKDDELAQAILRAAARCGEKSWLTDIESVMSDSTTSIRIRYECLKAATDLSGYHTYPTKALFDKAPDRYIREYETRKGRKQQAPK